MEWNRCPDTRLRAGSRGIAVQICFSVTDEDFRESYAGVVAVEPDGRDDDDDRRRQVAVRGTVYSFPLFFLCSWL